MDTLLPTQPAPRQYTWENHGSLWLCWPQSATARAYLYRLTGPEATWFGGALVVEPRYVEGLMAKLVEDNDE